MKKYTIFLFILTLAFNALAQDKQSVKKDDKQKGAPVEINTALLDLAKATLAAHGGDKYKNVKTLIVRGSVDVTAPNSPQTLPAAFAMVFSGEKYRLEIQSMVFNFQQIFDGQNTSSSMAGVSLPPINRSGLPLLTKIGEAGYVVSDLPEKLKKKKGFRITSPEGYYSDFILDEKTGRVKEYEAAYMIGNRAVSTSVAIDKYRDVAGVFINEKFSQRLDMGQFTSYASFKAKDILIDSDVEESVFTIK